MRRYSRLGGLSYLFITTCLMLSIQGCLLGQSRDDHGEVRGVPGRVGWKMEAPWGMVFIPGGSFTMGSVDQDQASLVNPPRQIAVSSFYMDKCVVTNNQYREFINELLAKATAGQGQQNPTGDQAGADTSSVVDGAARGGDQAPSSTVSKDFVMQKLYPNMERWKEDFAHHYADPIQDNYYEHPAFDGFPVVGITWEAAKAYMAWRTEYLNDYRGKHNLWSMPAFTLPTAAQWTYAARGGKEFAKYPWGGPYVRDAAGKLLANFKSNRGDYGECGYEYTAPVDYFPCNGYGLHIGGNVDEWTIDAYHPAATDRVCDLNPIYLDGKELRKVTKGGSWKDIARFLQTDVSDWEHKDSTRSYIGFRGVMPHIGKKPN